MGVLLIGETVLAHKKGWLKRSKRIHPKIVGEVPLILGPYIVGSLWMLRLGFGNFLRYGVINLVIHLAIVYGLMDWFRKIGYWSLKRMNKFKLLLFFVIEGNILY